MKNTSKPVICLCCAIVFLMMFACNDSREIATTTERAESATSTETELLTTAYYDIVAPYVVEYQDEDGNSITILRDGKGSEFYRGSHMGSFELYEKNLVICKTPGGNETYTIQYFDVERGLISPLYRKPFATGFGKVAHFSFDGDKQNMLIVNDMFNPEENQVTFEREGLYWGGRMWAPEAEYIVFPFTKAEFLDENRLHVRYLTVTNVDGKIHEEFVEEILKLN